MEILDILRDQMETPGTISLHDRIKITFDKTQILRDLVKSFDPYIAFGHRQEAEPTARVDAPEEREAFLRNESAQREVELAQLEQR